MTADSPIPPTQDALHVRTLSYPIQTWGVELRKGRRRRPGEELRIIERWLLNRIGRQGWDVVLGPIRVRTCDTRRGTTLAGIVHGCRDVRPQDREQVAYALSSQDGAGMVTHVVDASGWHPIVVVQSLSYDD